MALLILSLVACCPPTTQSLDSSFTAEITAQLSPNQFTVIYGSRPLTLIFEQAMTFEPGTKSVYSRTNSWRRRESQRCNV